MEPGSTQRPAVLNEPDLPPRGVLRARQLGRPSPLRHATPLGTIDGGTVAEVDQAGLLRRRGARWSLDWWVGAEDRWHHPSVEAAVRQELTADSPVVRTALRVPGGDVVQTAYGVRAGAADPDGGRWDDDAVVVDVTNDTSVPVALALVLRPVTLDGPGRLADVRIDGARVLVEGGVAVVVSRPVARVAAGHGAGAAAARLAAGEDEAPGQRGLVADDGDLEVAVVVPLAHGATVRVLVPAPPAPVPDRRARRGVPSPGPDWHAPEADAVVAGWATHSRAAATVETPESLHGRVVDAGPRILALAAGSGFDDGDGELDAASRAAQLAEVLVRTGTTEPLEPMLAALLEGRTLGGAVRLGDRSDATVALLHVVGGLLARSEGARAADELLALADAALRRIERREGTRRDAATRRSAGIAAAHLVAPLRSAGEARLAGAAEEVAEHLLAPGDAIGVDPPAPRTTTAAALAVRWMLRAGRPEDAARELARLLRAGSVGVLGDRLDADARPDGARAVDAPAIAARVGAVLDTVALETPRGADLLAGWTPSWFGAPVELHRMHTAHGELSLAVRWHGARPAVLWEVVGDEAALPPPVLRAPGLDDTWVGEGWRGEALLGEVSPPEHAVSLRPSRSSGASTASQLEEDPQRSRAPGEGESFG